MKKILITTVFLTFIGLGEAISQVGIGTTSPHVSAALDVESTTKGFLPPRLTKAERDGIATPANGLMVYNINDNCLNVYVGYWRNLCAFDNTNNTVTINFNGYSYEDVFNPATGLTWLDRNLGATAVATQPRGDFPDNASYIASQSVSFGDLYQWGRAADGHEMRDSPNYNAVLSTTGVANFNTSANAWDGEFILRNSGANNWVDPSLSGVADLWQDVNGTNNPCPSGYRIPTEAEWNAERLSWAPNNNRAGAFTSPLKLPIAGYRARANGSFFNVGSNGYYWSSTVSGSDARNLQINYSDANMNSSNRSYGVSVRCIKD